MKIGFVGGTGPEGRGLALRLALAGHEVIIGSRDEGRAREVARELQDTCGDEEAATRISGDSNEQAAGESEVVFITIPLVLVSMFGVVWWLVAALWLRRYDFASDHDTHARVFKLAAGTLAVVPAWCALAVIHAGDPDPTAAGETLPDGYVEGPSRVVPFRLGRVRSGVDDFVFV